MTTLEILAIALLFLLIGYLMGRCGGWPIQGVPQYPKSFIERLGVSKPPKSIPPYEDDPYAEAMEDEPTTRGTIEDG